MNVETLLHEEIVRELEDLKQMEVGTEQYKTTVSGLASLVDRTIEIDKMNIEHEEKMKTQKDEKDDRLVRNCLTAAGIVIPTIVTIWGTVKSIEFEKEGTITTIMGRGFINKLLPKK